MQGKFKTLKQQAKGAFLGGVWFGICMGDRGNAMAICMKMCMAPAVVSCESQSMCHQCLADCHAED